MTRIAILGNSHLAALRLGWEQIRPAHPDVEITFFGGVSFVFDAMTLAPDGHFGLHDPDAVAAEYRKMTRRSFGGLTVDLSPMDAVVIAGQDWHLHDLAELCAEYDIDGLLDSGAPRRLSAAAFEAMARGMIEASLPDPAWRHWTRTLKVLMPRPIPPESLIDANRPRSQIWARASAKTLRPVLDRYREFQSQIAHAHGYDVVHQPATTCAPSGLTLPEFARQPARLGHGGTAVERDNEHLNADFGALCLSALIGTYFDTGKPATLTA